MAESTIHALARELMARELQERPEQFDKPMPRDWNPGQSGPDMTPLNPEATALLGGLADAASTYSFLKRGTMQEGNAMWKPLDNHPLATALGVAGGALALKGGRHVLRKMGLRDLADMLAAVQGSHQVGLAALNAQHDYFGGARDSEGQMNTKVRDAITDRHR